MRRSDVEHPASGEGKVRLILWARPRDKARQLRTSMTDAERRHWSALRGRRLRGFKFRRQHLREGIVRSGRAIFNAWQEQGGLP